MISRIFLYLVLYLVSAIALLVPTTAFAFHPQKTIYTFETKISNIMTIDPPKSVRFVIPNEFQQFILSHISGNIIKGVYLGVGSERMFMAASQFPDLDGVVLVDNEKEVVRFNIVNLGLLLMAKDRMDFNYLKYVANFHVWLARIQEMKATTQWDDEGFKLLESPGVYKWFEETVRSHPLHFGMPVQGSSKFSEKANYHFNESQFWLLKRWAHQGQILVIEGDLSRPLTISRIDQLISQNRSIVSVLDMSNAWWPSHTGINSFVTSLQGLSKNLGPDSLLILTHIGALDWNYYVTTFERFSQKIDFKQLGYWQVDEFVNRIMPQQAKVISTPRGDLFLLAETYSCRGVFH